MNKEHTGDDDNITKDMSKRKTRPLSGYKYIITSKRRATHKSPAYFAAILHIVFRPTPAAAEQSRKTLTHTSLPSSNHIYKLTDRRAYAAITLYNPRFPTHTHSDR